MVLASLTVDIKCQTVRLARTIGLPRGLAVAEIADRTDNFNDFPNNQLTKVRAV